MSERFDNSLFGKVNGLFEKKKENQYQEEVLEAKPESLLEGIRNRFFRANQESIIIDMEAFEVLASDLEVEVLVEGEDSLCKGDQLIKEEVVLLENLNAKKDFVQKTVSQVNGYLSTIKGLTFESIDLTKDKFFGAKKATFQFTESTATSLVHFTKEVGRKYENMELSPKFYSLVRTIDLVVVITMLKTLVDKQKRGSKEFIALSCIITVLLILDKSKENFKQELGMPIIQEDVQYDLQAFLKSVTLKDAIETVEPILLIIPNGNYVLLILKLFI